MPPPKSPATLRAAQLLRSCTPAQARARLAEEGYKVSLSRLGNIRHGLREVEPVQADASELIPWSLRPGHRTLYAPMRLRSLARRMAGMSLSDLDEERLNRWLRALEDSDKVIDYDPDAERPFHPVPRRYTENKYGALVPVDNAWIRDPRINDDGSLKE